MFLQGLQRIGFYLQTDKRDKLCIFAYVVAVLLSPMAPPQGKCIRQEAGFLFMTEVFVPSYVGGGWRAEAFFTAIFTWQNFLGREDLDYCMVLNTTDSQGDNLVKQCLSFLGMVTSGKGPSAL